MRVIHFVRSHITTAILPAAMVNVFRRFQLMLAGTTAARRFQVYKVRINVQYTAQRISS
jgi:hypothetical protein